MKYPNSRKKKGSLLFPFCFLILMFLFSISTTHAQEVIPTTGGNASGNGGSVSYSVGQVVYTTNTGTSGTISQGVQHPYEISVITGIDDPFGIQLTCTAYPNPVSDYLTIEIKDYKNEDLSYLLYDINGRIIDSKQMTANRTTISMANLLPATYFLKIINKQTEVKIFKIVKK